MLGTLYIKSRPIRLAFLINPSDPETTREAIRIASSLWGGCYNPIIPIFDKSVPPKWRRHRRRRLLGQDLLHRFINLFDPDYLVGCSDFLPEYVYKAGVKLIKGQEIWRFFHDENLRYLANYGVSVFEVLNFIYEKHHKYVTRNAPRIILPQLPKSSPLFWAGVFGEYSDYISSYIDKHYKEALSIESIQIEPSTFPQQLSPELYFPRRISQFNLQVSKRSKHWLREAIVFLLDPNKMDDVISYWNVRAMGRDIFPAPKNLLEEPDIKNHVTAFLRSVHKPLPYREDVYESGRLMRSPHLNRETAENFSNGLSQDNLKDGKGKKDYFSSDLWFPLTNEQIATADKGSESDDVYFGEKQFNFEKEFGIQKEQSLIHFGTSYPDFIHWQPLLGIPRWINETNVSFIGDNGQFAQAFPRDNGEKVLRAISGITMFPDDDWRVGRNGLVKFLRDGRDVRWELPRAQSLFLAWLADHGWQAEISTPGIVANEMSIQLDGGIHLFGNEDFLKMLERMSSGPNGTELAVGEVKNRLSQIKGNHRLYNYLISKNVFKVGPKIQCPHCTKNTWYDLENVSEYLKCPKCLRTFSAIGHIDRSKWCYKTAGPFSISGFADGAYCVLLAIDFLSEASLHTIKSTSISSFCATDRGNEKIEADFGILWNEMWGVNAKAGVIFGECKTFGEFDVNDVKKMETLARSFPGAVLAFCTLRENLKDREIKQLKKLAKLGRKVIKDGRPLNPVLVLTQNELFGDKLYTPKSWKAFGFDKSVRMTQDIYELCDITQQVYLGFEPWRDELEKRYRKKIPK